MTHPQGTTPDSEWLSPINTAARRAALTVAFRHRIGHHNSDPIPDLCTLCAGGIEYCACTHAVDSHDLRGLGDGTCTECPNGRCLDA